MQPMLSGPATPHSGHAAANQLLSILSAQMLVQWADRTITERGGEGGLGEVGGEGTGRVCVYEGAEGRRGDNGRKSGGGG